MRIGRRNINANKKKGREGRDGGSKERIRKEMEEEKWDEIQREKKNSGRVGRHKTSHSSS